MPPQHILRPWLHQLGVSNASHTCQLAFGGGGVTWVDSTAKQWLFKDGRMEGKGEGKGRMGQD